MFNRAIFFISTIVFIAVFLINIGLLIDPNLASDAVEGALSVMLMITIVSMFICSSPNWRVLNLKNEPFWSKVFFEYGISVYYIMITILVIYYEFYSDTDSHYFTKTLGLAALLLLFSGLALRWSYNQFSNPLEHHHPM
ncbi:MAG: hypothetical protein H0T62_04280 [Parachlamydiaceae bacterium]|nr:hypothetical protein [Parachlamydiaceae bacterium]